MCLLWILREEVLITYGGILGIVYYDPDTILKEQEHHEYNNEILAKKNCSCM